MKRIHLMLGIVLIGLTATTFTSCKKASTAADDSVSAQDASSVSNAVSATSDDAASAAGQVKSFSGKTENGWWNTSVLCGASSVDSGTTGNRTITITYDGTVQCNGITRSGTVTVVNNSGIGWATAQSEIIVTYNNLKVTDIISNQSYTLNGSHTLLNETGGLSWQVIAGLASGPVSHRIVSSNMSITFPNGTQRTWTVDRTRTWSNSGGVITVSVKSEHSGNVSEMGSNRFGDAFTNTIVSPITANSNCLFRPYTGEFQHQISTRMATVVFGTDAGGTPVGSPTYCGAFGSYGYYITYTNGTTTRYRFVSYWR